MNHYPKHLGDWLKKTIGLSMIQEGAYNRMVDLYYINEAALPLKPDLYDDLRCKSRADREAVDFVLRRHFIETPDGYRHSRCDEELAKYADKAAKAKAAGEASGKARQKSSVERPLNVRSTPVEQTLNQPVTNNQEPIVEPKPAQAAPAGVRPEVWESWRKARGRKLTADAVRLQTKFLAAQGGDPNAIIEQSIRNGWAGLFPLKGEGSTGKGSKRDAVLAEIFKGVSDERNDERTIDGEAQRVA